MSKTITCHSLVLPPMWKKTGDIMTRNAAIINQFKTWNSEIHFADIVVSTHLGVLQLKNPNICLILSYSNVGSETF